MSFFQTALSTDKGINYTNMALMIISAAIAFIFPFHLFLFAYAFLGPLHYLTEISWLEKRNFFIKDKSDVLLYVLMAILLTVPVFNPKSSLGDSAVLIFMMGVFFTLTIFIFKNRLLRYIATAIIFFILYYFNLADKHFSILWFGIMLPTIIHVLLFTVLFMLYGALKSRSKTGYVSILVLVLCVAGFFVFVPGTNYGEATKYLQKSLSSFEIVNKTLMMMFGLDPNVNSLVDAINLPTASIFGSPAALIVARFIAFVYTYHYLNWFSKTTVIKWHDVSKIRMFVIGLLWALSIFLYLLNYKLGFNILFLLSVLHVFFEFPLNIVSIKGIGTELYSIAFKKS